MPVTTRHYLVVVGNWAVNARRGQLGPRTGSWAFFPSLSAVAPSFGTWLTIAIKPLFSMTIPLSVWVDAQPVLSGSEQRPAWSKASRIVPVFALYCGIHNRVGVTAMAINLLVLGPIRRCLIVLRLRNTELPFLLWTRSMPLGALLCELSILPSNFPLLWLL